MMRRLMTAIALMLMVSGALVAPAAAAFPVENYQFPSTNEENMIAGGPYVHLVDSGPGWILLEFVDPALTAKYEIRPDGVFPEGRTCRAHKVIANECTYPGWEVEEADGTELGYFAIDDEWLEPQQTIEIRKAGGAERDTDFDWVTFSIPAYPVSKAECKDGGYAVFGFGNQGQCIQLVNTGPTR